MRKQYLGETNVNPQALPALLFAGVLLEGGVVGYDTNTLTGGIGATWLGIGGDAKYQQDTVTVYLRAVSVKTGEVLTSVTASKTITSYAVDANVFRYIGSNSLLETEDGFTTNEPGLLALQQAIDKATYGLIMEGVDLKLWNFADPAAAADVAALQRRARWLPQRPAGGRRRAAQRRVSRSRSARADDAEIGDAPPARAIGDEPPHARPPSAALARNDPAQLAAQLAAAPIVPPAPQTPQTTAASAPAAGGEDRGGALAAASTNLPAPTGAGENRRPPSRRRSGEGVSSPVLESGPPWGGPSMRPGRQRQ